MVTVQDLQKKWVEDEKEVYRILKPDGVFFTQQVGGGNLSDLVEEFNEGS